MKCYTNALDREDKVVALGTFDGVHLGHQEVLEVAATLGMLEGIKSVGLSFLNHPLSVIGGETPPLLTLPAEKALLASKCGVTEMKLLPFTKALSQLSPEGFVEALVRDFGAKHLVVGDNYTFGAKGAGDIALLDKLSREMGFVLHVVPKLSVGGVDVSSTRIREALTEGDVRLAALLLGRAYSIGGAIVHGRRIGHEMGFPTINVKLPKGKILPKYGVYVGYANIEGEKKRYKCVLNLGMKPTVGSDVPTLEAHLLDFDGEVYGKSARVSFVARIRGEKKFASVEELSKRILKDIEIARTV